MNAEAAGRIRKLDVRMGVPDIGDDEYVYPVARLLIDGQDLLADVGKWRWPYVPWPAQELLTDDAPLLAAEPPRRVVVYVQSPDPCGLAPQISRDGDVVIWSDFHEVCEAGDEPLDLLRADTWSPVTLPDLVFDAGQYTAEVQRATAAREWLSDPWQTALLLRTYLRDDPLTPGDEWDLGFTEPDREHVLQYHISYWTEDLHAVATVSLTAPPGLPEQQARAMYDHLLTTPTARWPTTRHIPAPER